jgi:hypothetical protein
MSGEHQNGWNEWSKHVLIELERINNNTEALREDVQDIKIENAKEITALKTKMLMISSGVGGGGAAIVVLLQNLLGG